MTATDWVAPALALLLIAAFGMTIPRWSDHLLPWVATRVLLATSVVIARRRASRDCLTIPATGNAQSP